MKSFKPYYFVVSSIIIIATVVILLRVDKQSQQSTEGSVKGELVIIDEISVRLPIPVYEAAFTPFFTAEENGYFTENYLDVSFELGSRELNPVKAVVTGVNDFGVLGGPDTLLVARSKGQPLVAIAVLHRNSNFPGIITLKDSGITTLEQLESKDVGFFYGHISTDVIRNMFRKAGVGVNEVDVGFNYTPLIAGQLDAEWAFRTTAGVNLPAQGIDINFISPKEYGINTHGYTIFALKETIDNRPEVVERFLRALFKGVQDTLDKPESAIDNVLQQDENLQRDLELKRLELYNEVTSNSDEYPIGYMDYEMFQETYDHLVEEGVITKQFDIREAYDTQFLDRIYNR